jgi:hypothetical protein
MGRLFDKWDTLKTTGTVGSIGCESMLSGMEPRHAAKTYGGAGAVPLKRLLHVNTRLGRRFAVGLDEAVVPA